jgi:hypothetical protein
MSDSATPETPQVSPIDAAVANAMAEVAALATAWDKAVPTPLRHETREAENG